MQILNGQPVFDSSDVTFRNDGKYAYDDKNNVMGAWGGQATPGIGNPLNTDQTSFLDFLKNGGSQSINAGVGQQASPIAGGTHYDKTLTGNAAGLWGNSQNPYYNFMLQLLTGGKTSFDVMNPQMTYASSGGGNGSEISPIGSGNSMPSFDFNSYGDASPYAGGM